MRCVCKYWNTLISDPNFAKLLYTYTSPAAIIRRWHSRNFHVVEYDRIEWYERRNNPLCLNLFEVLEPNSSSSIKLDPKFEIPLPDPKSIQGTGVYVDVLSCNGLLYLSCSMDRDISLVCNPITVGTSTWINIEVDYPKNLTCVLNYSTYFNGTIHWVGIDVDGNFDTEQFQFFSNAPKGQGTGSILEFKGSIYFMYFNELLISMWMMERFGDGESWIPVYQYSVSSDRNTNSSITTSQLPSCIVYCDSENQEFRICATPWYDFKVHDKFQMVRLVPTLVPLKNIIIGDNVEVHSIYSLDNLN
ncbi:uncharacterized protein LOC107646316 [Arachis ipaensis]|uniref:uncharacterized protein LOC107646316 n=1 Tax=Arachis ipaensis TaxID=130454 RepID=UPI0007AF2DCC|nr:uncharacterized protein LOC107646316 [Arachis ipaensis]